MLPDETHDQARQSMTLVIDRELGVGKFTVYHSKILGTGEEFALKAFPLEPSCYNIFLQEKRILEKLKHKNIVRFQPQFHTVNKQFNCNFLLTEFAQYGNFFTLVTSKGLATERLVRTYFHHLIEGLEYMHSCGIAHLDIKLENLLLGNDFQMKITDFDQSQEIGDSCLKARGSAFYRAPEILENNCTNFSAADIYSAGIVLFTMKAGEFPFFERDDGKVIHYDLFISDNKLFWENKVSSRKNKNCFSEDFKELINGMLAADPDRRYKIRDIKSSNWYNGPILDDQELKEEMEKVWERIMFLKSLNKKKH